MVTSVWGRDAAAIGRWKDLKDQQAPNPRDLAPRPRAREKRCAAMADVDEKLGIESGTVEPDRGGRGGRCREKGE